MASLHPTDFFVNILLSSKWRTKERVKLTPLRIENKIDHQYLKMGESRNFREPYFLTFVEPSV